MAKSCSFSLCVSVFYCHIQLIEDKNRLTLSKTLLILHCWFDKRQCIGYVLFLVSLSFPLPHLTRHSTIYSCELAFQAKGWNVIIWYENYKVCDLIILIVRSFPYINISKNKAIDMQMVGNLVLLLDPSWCLQYATCIRNLCPFRCNISWRIWFNGFHYRHFLIIV